MELDSRKEKILKAIIDEYTATGEPVGSKRISALLDFPVSAATVRNDMAQLFDLGMLEQPHTSAGRVPSHLGYRYYLDHLLDPRELSPWEQATIQAMFNVANPDPEQLLEDAAQALAKASGCVTVFTTSTPRSVRVKKIELVPANRHNVVIMVIASNGVIKSKVCRMPFEVTAAMCSFFTDFAQKRLVGRSLNEIADHFSNSVSFGNQDVSAAFNALLSAIYDLCREINDGQFTAKGQINVLSQREPKDAAELLRLLDQRQELLNLVAQKGDDIQVIVGKENNRMELSDSAVVLTRYRVGRERCGTIGLIGPVRMNYAKLLPELRCFADLLGELLTEAMEEQSQG